MQLASASPSASTGDGPAVESPSMTTGTPCVTAVKRRSPSQVSVRRIGGLATAGAYYSARRRGSPRHATRRGERSASPLADMLDYGISYSVMTTQPPADVLREAKKGSAELVILALLEDTPRHGYELAARIENESDGALSYNFASLYATLYKLEGARLDPRPLGRTAGPAATALLSIDRHRRRRARPSARRVEAVRAGAGPHRRHQLRVRV